MGSVIADSSMLFLVDRSRIYKAEQISTRVRIVERQDDTGANLQVSALWGRQAVADAAIVIHGPANAVS